MLMNELFFIVLWLAVDTSFFSTIYNCTNFEEKYRRKRERKKNWTNIDLKKNEESSGEVEKNLLDKLCSTENFFLWSLAKHL